MEGNVGLALFTFCGCGIGVEGDAAAVDDEFQGEEGMRRDGNEPFCRKELAALVEGVDI